MLLTFAGIIFVGYFAASFATGLVAQARGRDGTGWFFIALLFTPLIALLFLVCLPIKYKENSIRIDKSQYLELHQDEDTKECPMCAEFVKANARLCRFCGYSFEHIPE